MGAVKTEVPTKVHRGNQKCENYYIFPNFIVLAFIIDNNVKFFL